jgi:Skp family chaperone for outer membrane proteins
VQLSRKNELARIASEAQQDAELMGKFISGSEDYKRHENKVTQLKAQHEAGREQAERDFAFEQAESMATLYKEVQAMVARVAGRRNLNYIVKVSNQPISGSDPNSVMTAISNTMVYADPRHDITNDVIHNLNGMYQRLGAAPATSMPMSQSAGAGLGGEAHRRGIEPVPLARMTEGATNAQSDPSAAHACRRSRGTWGLGYFHGADVIARFCPAEADMGIVFVRSDPPDRPAVPAPLENVIPSQRRTVIREGAATIEMTEHVMAALAGLRIDNCIVEIDAGECPGCDGSSRVFFEALDRAGVVEQDRPRKSLVLELVPKRASHSRLTDQQVVRTSLRQVRRGRASRS